MRRLIRLLFYLFLLISMGFPIFSQTNEAHVTELLNISDSLIRFRITGLYEHFTIGNTEYPFATLNTGGEKIIDVLSRSDSSKGLAIEYQRKQNIANTLVISSYLVAGLGIFTFFADSFTDFQPSETLNILSTISWIAGLTVDGIGIGFALSARIDLMDAVWEYNKAILKSASNPIPGLIHLRE